MTIRPLRVLICILHNRPSLPSPLFPYTTLFRSSGASCRPRLDGPQKRVLECVVHGEATRARPDGQEDRSMNTKSKDRKSTRLNSSHVASSYAVFCLIKINYQKTQHLGFRSNHSH